MRPSRTTDSDVSIDPDSTSAKPRSETARLLALLRGEGLTGRTLEKLLGPESGWTLRAVITDRVFTPNAVDDPDTGRALVGRSPDDGDDRRVFPGDGDLR